MHPFKTKLSRGERVNRRESIDKAAIEAFWAMNLEMQKASATEIVALSKEMREWYALLNFKKPIAKKRCYRIFVRVAR